MLIIVFDHPGREPGSQAGHSLSEHTALNLCPREQRKEELTVYTSASACVPTGNPAFSRETGPFPFVKIGQCGEHRNPDWR